MALLLGAPLISHASDVSGTVLGTTPALVASKVPALIATELSQRSATYINSLSTTELQAMYRYSPTSYSIVYNKSPTSAARMKLAIRSGSWPTLTTDMTLEQIYLALRAAGLSVPSALYEAGLFFSKRVSPAFGLGYSVGLAIDQLMIKYDYPLYDKIGGTVEVLMERIDDGTIAHESVAFWEWQLDASAFDIPLWQLSTDYAPYGDIGQWGMMDDAASLFDNGGYCLNPGMC